MASGTSPEVAAQTVVIQQLQKQAMQQQADLGACTAVLEVLYLPCPALPCPALPCPALPCLPCLPCPCHTVYCKAQRLNAMVWRYRVLLPPVEGP